MPGLPETAYTQIDPGDHWLANCYAKKDAVLSGILPDLANGGQEIGTKDGRYDTCGNDREVTELMDSFSAVP